MTPYDDDIATWPIPSTPPAKATGEHFDIPIPTPPDRTFRKLTVIEIKDDPHINEKAGYKGGKKYKSKRRFLYDMQGGKCAYCELEQELERMTIDHIIPKSKGGTDEMTNLAVCCFPCNSLKGNFETFEEVSSLVADRFLATRREMEKWAHLLAFFKRLRDKGYIKR